MLLPLEWFDWQVDSSVVSLERELSENVEQVRNMVVFLSCKRVAQQDIANASKLHSIVGLALLQSPLCGPQQQQLLKG